MASEANVNFNFFFNQEGMYLSVSGFSHSLNNALVELVKLFKNLTAHDKEEKLRVQIETHMQEMKNFYLKTPYMVAMGYLEKFLVDPHTEPVEKLEILQKGVSIDSLVDFVQKFSVKSRYEWIIQGNVTREEALSMSRTVHEITRDQVLHHHNSMIYRTVAIQPKSNFVFTIDNVNPNETNSSIATFLQCGKLDIKSSSILLVIESLLRDRFFDQIRTKQSLGYIASLFRRAFRLNEGLCCIVQSSVKSPEYIWLKIKEFFDESEKFIKEISDDLFSTHVQAVITEKKQKDRTLGQEITFNAAEVKNRQFLFDRRERQVKSLEELKKEELVQFYHEHFVDNLRRLDLEIVASQHKEDNEKLMEDNKKICAEMGVNRVKTKSIADFKRRNSLYPDFFSLLD